MRTCRQAFRGGYDRNLRNSKALMDVFAYIHNNPVKRGLACQPEDWF